MPKTKYQIALELRRKLDAKRKAYDSYVKRNDYDYKHSSDPMMDKHYIDNQYKLLDDYNKSFWNYMNFTKKNNINRKTLNGKKNKKRW